MKYENIVLAITYRCNARCVSCSRYCDIIEQPNSDMTVDQIKHFIHEVRSKKHRFQKISVLGGEPVLHEDIDSILNLLYMRLVKPGYTKVLHVATNGVKEYAWPEFDGFDNSKLYRTSGKHEFCSAHGHFEVVVNPPSHKHHRCQLVSPADSGQKLRKWCKVPKHCGLLLDAHGYYMCGPAASISRLLKIPGAAKMDMPESVKAFWDTKDSICKHCQVMARNRMRTVDHGNIITETYKRAINNLDKPENSSYTARDNRDYPRYPGGN